MTLRPTNELVAVHWLRGLLGISAVSTVLPGPDDQFDNTSWAGSGFVQVVAIGGAPDVDIPIRHPVFSVDCWAVNVGKKNPPWGKANALAEAIVNSVYSYHTADQFKRRVALPGNYAPALVIGAQVLGEPARRPADPANYARYGFELELTWLTN